MSAGSPEKTETLAVAQPAWSTLVVSESERAEWLGGLLTADVTELAPGQGAWGLQLTKTGRILSEVNAVATADRIFLSVSPGRAAALLDFYEGYLIMEDAEIVDASADYAWLTLHGSRAADVASELAPDQLVARAAIDWTGLGGAALIVAPSAVPSVLSHLADAHGVATATEDSWERLRIERLVPSYGVDYDERHSPHDASLERRAVSWTKGCYLGQEVVCTQDMRGKVRRRLVSLTVEGAEPPTAGAEVQLEGEAVGEVTSGAPGGGADAVALARIKTKAATPGQRLRVGGRTASVAEPSP